MAKNTEFKQTLKQMTPEELSNKLKEDTNRLKKLEFAHAVSPLENPQSIKTLRRDIARIQTQITAVKSKGGSTSSVTAPAAVPTTKNSTKTKKAK